MTQNGGASYNYDGENRIATTAGYTYTYDADGKRIKKHATADPNNATYYYYGPGSTVLAERTGAGVWTDYIFAGGKRVAKAPAEAITSNTEYYHSDHLGTASWMTNASGAQIYSATYLPYGYELNASSSTANHYKFTGKERDAESNLDYFGARYYATTQGRWMTPDWSDSPEPVPYARYSDPQSLNLYAYSTNPLRFRDFDGHQSSSADRQAAVREAWKMERDLVMRTGRGTIDWSPAQKKELLQTGKVEGYVGHHINSVSSNPELARNPNNIKFVKGQAENLAEHGGNFRNPTSGKLINRASGLLQILSLVVDALKMVRFNENSAQTGLELDSLGNLSITNMDQAAQTLDPGTQAKTADGEIFTLGSDRVWRNSAGDTVYYDAKTGTNKISRVCC